MLHMRSNKKRKVLLLISTEIDVLLSNGVTVYYSSNQTVTQLSQVVIDYESIWSDRSFAKLPEENWKKIPLKSD